MSDQAYDPGLAPLEAALAALAPTPARMDRDRLMFWAGQATPARRSWLWPCTTAALAAVNLALCGTLLLRPAPQPLERVVYVPTEVRRPAPAPPSSPVVSLRPPLEDGVPWLDPAPWVAAESEGWQPELSYYKLQQHVLRWGLDGLPQPHPAEQPESLEEFLKSL